MNERNEAGLEERDTTSGHSASEGRARATLLDTRALAPWCVRSHLPVPPQLAPFVEVVWTMQWSLEGRAPFRQRALPNPCIQIVVDSRGGARVMGVVTGAFEVTLEGSAFVLGVKFRPGGFAPFLNGPAAALTDRELPLAEVLAGVDEARVRDLAAGADGAALLAELTSVLLACAPRDDDRLALVTRAMTCIADDASVRRVEDAARACGMSVRALQRLFHAHVGVSPLWVIRRMRLKEAAARVESDDVESWAELALSLGYYDQAHLVNDFTRMMGAPPGRYARTITPP